MLAACAMLLAAFAAPGLAVAEPTGPTAEPTAEPTAPTSTKQKKSKKKAKKSELPAFKLSLGDTYRYRGRSYVLPRARVEVKGEVAADLDGQTVTLVIKKNNRTAKSARVKLDARGGKSTFKSPFRVGKTGKYIAEIELSPEQAALVSAGSGKSVNLVKTRIHRGSSGVSVRVFQSKLRSLHYVVPRNGHFDAATGRAFMAFRKVNGMARNESAGKTVARKLAADKGAFRLRYPKAGRHVEVSIKKQVMVFADNGRVLRTYHVSTGAPGTPTVRGTYHVYMKDAGTNAKGMVKSSYFIRGYAIHGYASVPPYNASHGCVRVPVPNAASIFAWVNMGTRIDTYY